MNITTKLDLDRTDEEVIILGTYPNLKERVRLTKETITSLKPLGRKIILVSHYPVDEETQRMVDYYIYDAYNPLCHHSYYTRFYNQTNEYHAEININGLKDSNQSLTVLVNMYNAARAAQDLGFKRFFYTTYDVVLDERDIPMVNESFKTDKKLYVATLPTPQGKGIQTNGMMLDTDFFLKEFDDIRTPEDWNLVCDKRKCQNYLEDYLSKVIFSFNPNDIKVITNDEGTLLINSGLGTSSNSEYYSILPIVGKPNKYMFYFFTYNIDGRVVDVSIDDLRFTIDISKNREYKREFEYIGNNTIELSFYDGHDVYKKEKFEMNPSTIEKYQSNTGRFEWKKKDKPKIKLVHIQTTLNDEREQASRDSLEKVKDYGWEYILHLNEPYKSLPPSHNCIRPLCVSMELFSEELVNKYGTALTPAHYGCYEAFKNAILGEFHDCDYLIVCEGDCIIEVGMDEFINTIEECSHELVPNGIKYMSFGDKDTLEYGWPQSPIVKDINDKMYLTNIFSGNNMGIVKKRITTQADGFSLIDNMQKTFRK